MRFDSCWSRWATVPSTFVRLSMTLPITRSLSASDEVSEATCASRSSTVAPSPWKTWMIS